MQRRAARKYPHTITPPPEAWTADTKKKWIQASMSFMSNSAPTPFECGSRNWDTEQASFSNFVASVSHS